MPNYRVIPNDISEKSWTVYFALYLLTKKYIIIDMSNPNEMRELEKLSAGLVPKKSSCKMCKVILVATIILFICSLVLFVFNNQHILSQEEQMVPRFTSPSEQSERIKTLREYIQSKQGTSTTIIVKSQTK